jgi:hypothetical protein
MVNDQRGLEHGFTVYERPAGDDGPLTLWLSVHGGLQPDVQADGRGVIFRDVNHKSALTYTGLTVVMQIATGWRRTLSPAMRH